MVCHGDVVASRHDVTVIVVLVIVNLSFVKSVTFIIGEPQKLFKFVKAIPSNSSNYHP